MADDNDLNGLILRELLESQRQLSTKLDNHYADLQARLSEYALQRELDALKGEVGDHFKTVDRTLEEYKRGRVPEFWKNLIALVLSGLISAFGTHYLDGSHAPVAQVQTAPAAVQGQR